AISNTQISGLVSAMAAYQAAHPGFNPTTATVLPGDASLATGYLLPVGYTGPAVSFDALTESAWTHTFASTESAVVVGSFDVISLLSDSASILAVGGIRTTVNSTGNSIQLLPDLTPSPYYDDGSEGEVTATSVLTVNGDGNQITISRSDADV